MRGNIFIYFPSATSTIAPVSSRGMCLERFRAVVPNHCIKSDYPSSTLSAIISKITKIILLKKHEIALTEVCCSGPFGVAVRISGTTTAVSPTRSRDAIQVVMIDYSLKLPAECNC